MLVCTSLSDTTRSLPFGLRCATKSFNDVHLSWLNFCMADAWTSGHSRWEELLHCHGLLAWLMEPYGSEILDSRSGAFTYRLHVDWRLKTHAPQSAARHGVVVESCLTFSRPRQLETQTPESPERKCTFHNIFVTLCVSECTAKGPEEYYSMLVVCCCALCNSFVRCCGFPILTWNFPYMPAFFFVPLEFYPCFRKPGLGKHAMWNPRMCPNGSASGSCERS